jgi:amino acid transporter
MDSLGIAVNAVGVLYVFSVLPFTLAFYPQANAIMAPVVGLILSLPIAAVYILLSIAIPRAGGDYVWVGRILHPSIGFINSLAFTLIWLAIPGAGAASLSPWAISAYFYDLGKLYNNQNYLNLATFLQGANPSFAIAVVALVVAGLLVALSTGLVSKIMRFWAFVSIAIVVIFCVTVLAAGNSAFISNFNALSGANYNTVISEGAQAGASPGIAPIFSEATLTAGVVGIIGYVGFNFSAYFSSEVRELRKSQIVAQLGSLFIFGVVYVVTLLVWYFGEGPAFANAMSTLWAAGSANYPYITVPLASSISMFWTQNIFLISLFCIGYIAGVVITASAQFFAITRNLFAWSFDRIMPESFASVNDRTHTPLNATIIIVIITLIFSYISVYQYGLLALYFTYSIAGLFIVYLVVSISAIVFPYTKKELFESAFGKSKMKIGGVPLISILGVISAIASLVVVYALVAPAIGGPFLATFIEGVVPTFIIGLVVYMVAWAVRRRQGINIDLLQAELPPE